MNDKIYDELYHCALHKQVNELNLQIEKCIKEFERQYPGYTLEFDVQDGMGTYFPKEKSS